MCLLPLLEKGEKEKNGSFAVLDEGETFSTTFSRRAEQGLETVPPCFRKLEKN